MIIAMVERTGLLCMHGGTVLLILTAWELNMFQKKSKNSLEKKKISPKNSKKDDDKF